MSLIICLFLSEVLLICDGLHVLGPSDPLIAELGGSVMLPCYVEAPIPLEELEVEWKRTDSETLVHLFQDGENQPESQDQAYSGRASFFTEEVERGNFSLLLTNLTTKDAGVYNCSVYSQLETGKTSVEIKEIERLIVTGDHVVSAYAGEDITMNCSVDSSVPPEKLEEVSWKKVDQQIPVLVFQGGEVLTESTHERYTDRVEFFSPEEIQKGNFSLRLKDLRTEDKGLYICEVFSGEFAANTTVEVQQLGFSSMHTGILFLCVLAFVFPVFLSYPASTSLTKNDYSRRALAVQYTLVCCPNITMCLAFILWGVTEGFFTEAATCSALNLLRILFLFRIAPYLNTWQENIRRFIEQSAITLGYAVITSFAYSGLALHSWRLYQGSQKIGILIPSGFLLIPLLLLYIFSFIQGLKKIKQELWNPCLTEAVNFGRISISMYVTTTAIVLPAVLPLLQICLNILCVIIIMFKGITRALKGISRALKGLFRGSKVLIWMSVLLILEAISASSSVYSHYVSLDTLDSQKERVGLACVTAYLYILSGMILFKALFRFYEYFTRRPHSNRTRQSVELNPTVAEAQKTSGRAIVYMLGAVGVIFVNSIALAVELILKARNGERTVEDLRVILIPSECVFAICCLMLQMSEFGRTNRERLMYDLKDLRQLCGCKQVSADSTVQNHELQALQNSRS